jgi:hypothetical protein
MIFYAQHNPNIVLVDSAKAINLDYSAFNF